MWPWRNKTQGVTTILRSNVQALVPRSLKQQGIIDCKHPPALSQPQPQKLREDVRLRSSANALVHYVITPATKQTKWRLTAKRSSLLDKIWGRFRRRRCQISVVNRMTMTANTASMESHPQTKWSLAMKTCAQSVFDFELCWEAFVTDPWFVNAVAPLHLTLAKMQVGQYFAKEWCIM